MHGDEPRERGVTRVGPRRGGGSSGLDRRAFLAALSCGAVSAGSSYAWADRLAPSLQGELASYRACLAALRRRNPGVRRLPPSSFFLFGAGPRRSKLVYQTGALREDGGSVVARWEVVEERIVPSAYAVELKTAASESVRIYEDESGVWIEQGGERRAVARGEVRLPAFEGHPWAPVLRALHHEILVNVVADGPLPNRFVYRRPWYRDGAMVAMVLRRTGNLDLVLRDWILKLAEPFDRNNGGVKEADNPGQLLYLLSLVAAGREHPLVAAAVEALGRFEAREPGPSGSGEPRLFVSGPSDFAPHPVYQTKWAKLGLRSVGAPDPYTVPRLADSYSSLFWWDYRDLHVPGARFDAEAAEHYPYLVWAEDHFYGETRGLVGDRDYPLSWESRASQADYEGLRALVPAFAEAKLAAPHTWHAAEMFLLLHELRLARGGGPGPSSG